MSKSSNIHVHTHRYINSLPPSPPMPNYAHSSEQIEQSLHKSKKFCKNATPPESPESSMSANSNFISKSSNTMKRMVIFDWDDTLFPTTAFVHNSGSVSIDDLNKWGSRVYKLLKKYIENFGAENIYIITNGGRGWIQYSLKKVSKQFQLFLKKISPLNSSLNNYFKLIERLLKIYRIKTISARSLYQSKFPNEYKKWKKHTFIYFAYNHFQDNKKGIIISIGDSSDEWFASSDCVNFLTNLNIFSTNFYLQRIKLKTKPRLDELIKEWDELITFADSLKSQNKSFSIMY